VFSTTLAPKTQTTLSSTFTNLKTPIVFGNPTFGKPWTFFRIYFPNILKAFFFDQEKTSFGYNATKNANMHM
jgi:hypothetical protein